MIFRHTQELAPSSLYRDSPPLTVRWASPADAEALEILAELDEAAVPQAPRLLGFVGDELWAAVSLSTGAAISDPFRPSADVARLVSERGRQLTVAARRSGRFGPARRRRRAAVLGLRPGNVSVLGPKTS